MRISLGRYRKIRRVGATMAVTAAMLKHIDGEIANVIELGREIAAPSADYPEPVRRSMAVAYCSYYRVLLEFFHNGREGLVPRAKPPNRRNLLVRHVLPSGADLGVRATARDKKRFRAADRLGAHLSMDRSRYHRSTTEWGSAADRLAIWRRAKRLLQVLPEGPSIFSRRARQVDLGR
jgi:hypothetical protein